MTVPEGPRSARGLWRILAVPGMRPAVAIAVATRYTTWSAVAAAGPAALERLGQPAPTLAAGIPDEPLPRPADAEVLGYFDEGYPPDLRDIPNPPAVLWLRGRVPDLPGVAVVGTRDPSPAGSVVSARIAASAVRAGLAVVAGGSPGIDHAAHEAALGASGPTVAVLGGGLDAVPSESAALVDRIVSGGGAVLSERPPDDPGSRTTLDARDRIQSGLSAGVVVVQAPWGDPTMHTARFAIVQRRVLATVIPGPGPEVRDHAQRNAGNLALADPAGTDPDLLHASGRLGATIANRRPCADVVIRTGADLPPLWQRLAGPRPQPTASVPTPRG